MQQLGKYNAGLSNLHFVIITIGLTVKQNHLLHLNLFSSYLYQKRISEFSKVLYLMIAYHKNKFVCLNTAITRINKTETSTETSTDTSTGMARFL